MLIAIALGSLAAGLSVARGLTRDAPDAASASEPRAFPNTDAPSAEVPSAPTTATPHAPPVAEGRRPASAQPTNARAPAPPSTAIARAAQAAAKPALAPIETPPSSAPEAAVASTRNDGAAAAPQVALGIVAYTRCDGLPQLDKRYPCPRDLRLEARVRRVINDLARCPLTPQQRGLGDLRLEFERGLPTRMRIDAAKQAGFDRDAVSRCAGSSLAEAHTTFSPDRMVVLFYFELR